MLINEETKITTHTVVKKRLYVAHFALRIFTMCGGGAIILVRFNACYIFQDMSFPLRLLYKLNYHSIYQCSLTTHN